MIRIRFPNGQAIKYNNANGFNVRTDGAIEITQRANGQVYWYAVLPPHCPALIEGADACAVNNPITELTVEKALEMVLSNLRSINGYSNLNRLSLIKTKLRDFDARSRCWKKQ